MSFWKKKTVSLFLTVFMLASCMTANAFVLEEKEEKTLVKGVTYTRMQRLYDYGWQDIHVVRADLSEPHLAFDVLKSAKGNSFLEDTLTSAVANDTVAAVNADFFAAKKGQTGRGSAVGVEIIDGILRTTPASDEKMHAIYETEDGEIYFNEFSYDITITAPNGNSEKIRHINKYDDLNGIVLYNENWDGLSLGATYGVIELVVDENNIVTEKRRFADPVEIPENGYILSSDLDVHTFLDDNLNVGDEVKIEITTSPNYEVIETAVGGGGMLVVDGVAQTSFSHNISGYNPRTAVGTDKSGKVMYLVVVDGRRNLAHGMTQTQLAELMVEIGCYNAMNFDGGGSSLLAIKEDGEQKVANTLSGGYKRPVTNSLGIFSTAEVGETARLELTSDDTAMFANTTRLLTLSGYDENSLKTQINLEEVKWSLDGVEGNITDGMVLAKTAGTARVTAQYRGLSADYEIKVMDKPYYLEFDEAKIQLKSGESKILSLIGRDEKGFSAKIYAKDTDISIDEECGKVEGNLLTANKNSGIISAGFGSAKAYCALSIDGKSAPSLPESVGAKDSANIKAEALDDNGFIFNVFGNIRKPETLFDLFLVNKSVEAVKDESVFQSFVGSSVDSELLDEVSETAFLANAYGSFNHNGSTFITVNNTDGTLFGNDISQWKKLKADSKNATGNLFILLNKITISSNEIELKNFKEIVEAANKRGVNVYVIGGGWKNRVDFDNGVRYITTAGIFPSVGIKAPATNISYVKYLRVVVNGSEVTYSFENILKN